ncbi:MAG: LysE family transporter [Bacteroidetes bacterium]|nr:LysE family transporter [Bacteroidota bacterium]
MSWLAPLGYGILTGFLMSVLLGVIFFMLIQTGVKHGYKKGITIASGVIAGDIVFVILAIGFTGYISRFLAQHSDKVSITGGIVLLIMGVFTYLQERKLNQTDKPLKGMKHTRDFFIKPFFINLLNPANAAWWLGLYSIPPALNYTTPHKIVFAIGAVGTVFFTEIGIAVAADKLKKFIKPVILKRVDSVVAAALILVGLHLLAKGILG